MHSQFNGERTVLSTNGPGTAADPCVKTHFKSYLTSYTKWTQNANTKQYNKTLKIKHRKSS